MVYFTNHKNLMSYFLLFMRVRNLAGKQ